VSDQHRVLIVDSSEETREVLQTVLERHGVATMSSDRLCRGVALARENQPDLIVLDLESVDASHKELLGPLMEPAGADVPHLLILGTFRRQGELFPQGEFVSKPYQYGALIRKIEELIGEAGPCRHCSSSAGSTKAPALS
jgi:DNA-binding response OmpR family regulator